MSQGRKPLDLSGRVFGRVTAIDRAGTGVGQKSALWRCTCACGTEIVVSAALLVRSSDRCCGCTVAAPASLKSDPAFTCWLAMIHRCTEPTTNGYARYGGRGITVCDRWRRSFAAFLADMGARPSSKHSIERKNNDGNYEPDNCRWATAKEQASNRAPRTSRTRSASVAAEDVGAP